jgi:hypothetical protein
VIQPTWSAVAKPEHKMHRPYKISNFSGFKNLSGLIAKRSDKLDKSELDTLQNSGNLSLAKSEANLAMPWVMQASFHNTEAKRLKEIDHFTIRGSRLGDDDYVPGQATASKMGQLHLERSLGHSSLYKTEPKAYKSHSKFQFFHEGATSSQKPGPASRQGEAGKSKRDFHKKLEVLKEQELFMRQKNTLPNIIGFDFK